MKKIVVIAVMFLAATFVWSGVASAITVPTIDGIVTNAGEWADYLIFGTDPNEGGISDSWDLSAVYMKVITGMGVGIDGLYFRMDTYGSPTFTGGPGAPSGTEAFFQFWLDYDGNLIEDKLVDLNDKLDPGSRIVGVYTGAGFVTKVGDNTSVPGTTNALGSIIEMYVPSTLLSTTIPSNFGLYARLDNSGDEADDKLPGAGYLNPVPEPASAMLLGFGLIGLVGAARRKFKA